MKISLYSFNLRPTLFWALNKEITLLFFTSTFLVELMLAASQIKTSLGKGIQYWVFCSITLQTKATPKLGLSWLVGFQGFHYWIPGKVDHDFPFKRVSTKLRSKGQFVRGGHVTKSLKVTAHLLSWHMSSGKSLFLSEVKTYTRRGYHFSRFQ